MTHDEAMRLLEAHGGLRAFMFDVVGGYYHAAFLYDDYAMMERLRAAPFYYRPSPLHRGSRTYVDDYLRSKEVGYREYQGEYQVYRRRCLHYWKELTNAQ